MRGATAYPDSVSARPRRRPAALPGGSPQTEWLMQPRWLPAFRAGLGVAVLVSALGVLLALALVGPWRPGALPLVAAWTGYGVFLVWASRRERSGTRLEDDRIVVTSGTQVDELTRQDILDLRHDQPPPHAWRVQAVLRDGRLLTLLAVPPGELERLRRWHAQRPTGAGGRDPR